MKPIVVSIDGQPITYHLRQTRAPRDYDGFGTLTVSVFDDMRWVLIKEEHLQWQSVRYSSGMFAAIEPDEHMRDQIIQELWKRFQNNGNLAA